MSKLYGDIQQKSSSLDETLAITFNQDEYKSLSEIIEEYLSHSSPQQKPHALIVTGPMAAGKTSIIIEKYISTHVYIDHDDVLINVTRKFKDYENGKLAGLTIFCLNQLIEKSISSKRNIVIESLGYNEERLNYILKSLNKFCYICEFIIIHCDIEEGLRRHLERTQTGELYPTSYYSEEITFESLRQYLDA